MARASSAVAAKKSKKKYFCLPVGALPAAPPPPPASPPGPSARPARIRRVGGEGKDRLVVRSQAMEKNNHAIFVSPFFYVLNPERCQRRTGGNDRPPRVPTLPGTFQRRWVPAAAAAAVFGRGGRDGWPWSHQVAPPPPSSPLQ